MAQIPKIIDITRTYVPVDPQNFPSNLIATEKQDEPTRSAPILAYEGYNFLPTSYGYKSYFGTNAQFDILPLPAEAKVDEVFIVATKQYKNFFVALCDIGIYTNTGEAGAEWVHQIVLAAAPAGTHREWTYTVIENKVYYYQQGADHFWEMDSVTPIVFTECTPNFINMEGQRGIFKAGSRLGFWDSMGSISWSSIDDYEDFTPSIKTLAGSAIWIEVKGPIVTILSCGDGFIIYGTTSIVQIRRNLSSALQWEPNVIMGTSGPAYSTQVTSASPDTVQFAYTGAGLLRIENGTAENIITETIDLLKESIYPVSIRLMENRYLVFELIEDKFVEGLVEYKSVSVDNYPYNLSASDDLSWLTPKDIAQMTSLGLFKEQQESFMDELTAQGYPLPAPNTFGTPVWKYSLIAFDATATTETQVAPVGKAHTVPTSPTIPAPGVGELSTTAATRYSAVSDGTYSPRIVQKPVVYSSENIYTGVEAANTIAALQKALWADGVTAIEAALNARLAAMESTARTASATWTQWRGITCGSHPSCDINNNPPMNSSTGPLWPTGAYTGATGAGWIFGSHIADKPGSSTFSPTDYCCLTEPQDVTFTFHPCSMVAVASFTRGKLLSLSTGITRKDVGGDVQGVVLPGMQDKFSGSTELIECRWDDAPITLESTAYLWAWDYIDINGQEQRLIQNRVCRTGNMGTFPNIDGPGTLTPSKPYPWKVDPIDFPATTITLQDGSPGPLYPVNAGGLVYDMHYKKWGKLKCRYLQMLDLLPINTNQGNIVNVQRFGINAAVMMEDHAIRRFDNRPEDSMLKYGKIGFYRLGLTEVEEIRYNFRIPCTGSVIVEGSLDGRNPEEGMRIEESYVDATHGILFPPMAARWHTITFKGNFDLTHLEYRGTIQGRR